LPNQEGQGVLKLCSLECHGGQLRLRCLKNRLRLSHVEVRHRSASPQVAGQFKGFGKDLDTGVKDRPLSVQRSQGEIVHRYLRLNHQFDGFKIIRAGLSLRPRGFNAAADPAPEINLVAETQGHIKIIECCAPPRSSAGRAQWSIRRTALTSI
jgi:hypothetical protein